MPETCLSFNCCIFVVPSSSSSLLQFFKFLRQYDEEEWNFSQMNWKDVFSFPPKSFLPASWSFAKKNSNRLILSICVIWFKNVFWIFDLFSSDFLGLMKKVSRSPMVMDVLNIQGVQKSLERLADLLGKIQKALGEYLERERTSFPRFYFVGDEV